MKLYVTFGYRPNAAHIDAEPASIEFIAEIPEDTLVTFWGVEMDAANVADTREICQWERPDVCGFVNIENCARHGTPHDSPKRRMTILRQPLSMHSTTGRIHTMCGPRVNLYELVAEIEAEAQQNHGGYVDGMNHAAEMVRGVADHQDDVYELN